MGVSRDGKIWRDSGPPALRGVSQKCRYIAKQPGMPRDSLIKSGFTGGGHRQCGCFHQLSGILFGFLQDVLYRAGFRGE